MVRSRCIHECLVLLPMIVIWMVFQISHVQRYTDKIAAYEQQASKINSTDFRQPKPLRKLATFNRSHWTPTNVSHRDYEEDFNEYLKPAKKVTKTASPKKLWFLRGGNVWPEDLKDLDLETQLWPEQKKGDRIVEQLMYAPKDYLSEWSAPSPLAKFELYDSRRNLKKILLVGNVDRSRIPPGRSVFWQAKCPVNTCTLATSLKEHKHGDAVVFKGRYVKDVELHVQRKSQDVWVFFLDKSPLNIGNMGGLDGVVNWTASYRHDSDIVVPHGKFVSYKSASQYSPEKLKVKKPKSTKNYAAGKIKKVAWFVRDCDKMINGLQYAKNLSLHIEVDVYGSCGTKTCPKRKMCLEILDYYKFYLSFEESNCREYITETFFETGLGRNILPIVMGPPREDYDRIAPPNSYIHVDDFAEPKDLAHYLLALDSNDSLYNRYFKWKDEGELIKTHFWCRLCALLHTAERKPKSYGDIQKWWSGPGVCQV